jgi:hypothetical protein
MSINRKKGKCPLCPAGSKDRILVDGLCSPHYWEAVTRKSRVESQKKFAQKRSLNQKLQLPENQEDTKTGFDGFLPTLKHMDLQEVTLDYDPNRSFEENFPNLTCVFLGPNVPHNQNLQLTEFQKVIKPEFEILLSKKLWFNQNPQFIEIQSLKNWFEFMVQTSDFVCENCGTPINAPGITAKKSCQAHILPKKYFGSVALHPLNRLILGGIFSDCGCHYSYDFSWKRAEKMKCFPLAIARFLYFKNQLTKSELSKLPDPFKKYL